LLLNQALGYSHERRVFIRGVFIDNVFGVLLRVGEVFAAA